MNNVSGKENIDETIHDVSNWGLHRNHWRRHRSTWRRRSKPWFNQPDLFTRRKSESWGSVLLYICCVCQLPPEVHPAEARPSLDLGRPLPRSPTCCQQSRGKAQWLPWWLWKQGFCWISKHITTHNTTHPSQESFLEETETVNQLNQDDVDYVADAIEQAVSRRYS